MSKPRTRARTRYLENFAGYPLIIRSPGVDTTLSGKTSLHNASHFLDWPLEHLDAEDEWCLCAAQEVAWREHATEPEAHPEAREILRQWQERRASISKRQKKKPVIIGKERY